MASSSTNWKFQWLAHCATTKPPRSPLLTATKRIRAHLAKHSLCSVNSLNAVGLPAAFLIHFPVPTGIEIHERMLLNAASKQRCKNDDRVFLYPLSPLHSCLRAGADRARAVAARNQHD